jgi:hypothetical protein
VVSLSYHERGARNDPVQTVHPSFVSAGEIAMGSYATTTAALYQSGFYTIWASSTTMAGIPMTGSRTIQIDPGDLGDFRFRFPPTWEPSGKTKLFNNFTMAVEALTKDGQVKQDYIPDGELRFMLNATATGFLGIETLQPVDFVQGVATISNQTYNKSQVLYLKITDSEAGISSRSGLLTVYGDPVKFSIDIIPATKGTPGNPIYWRNLFQARLTARDTNGFPVTDYSGNVEFSILPGTIPTAATASVMAPYPLQFFATNPNAQATFTLKVDYDLGYTWPINLRLKASDTVSGPAQTTTDLVFERVEVFDSWEFIQPTHLQKRQRGVPFSLQLRAVSNYGNPWPTASAPIYTYELVEPPTITGLIATPPLWTAFAFAGTADFATSASFLYDQTSTASVRLIIDDGLMTVASIVVPLMLEEPVVRTNLIQVAPSSRFILSIFAQTLDRDMKTGTGQVEVALYSPADPASYTHLVTLNAQDGSSGTAGTTSGHHAWKRYWWWFDTAPDSASMSLRLSVNDGVVYFDAAQLEKALVPGQTIPTPYSPHAVNIVHPPQDTSRNLSGEQFYWEW